MYIPEFWVGFMCGAVVTFASISVWAIIYNNRHR